MEELLQTTESTQALNPITTVMEQLMPTIIISTILISVLFFIYLVAAIASRISSHKRSVALAKDVHAIRELLEKNQSAIVEPTRPQPEVKLADGAIVKRDPLYEEQKIESERIV